MEVRRIVVVEEHRDHDAEEATDRRHDKHDLARSGAFAAADRTALRSSPWTASIPTSDALLTMRAFLRFASSRGWWSRSLAGGAGVHRPAAYVASQGDRQRERSGAAGQL